MKSYHKYLSVTEAEKKWGFYITTAGYSKINTNQVYPSNKEHPSTHSFSWNKGRILDGYYLVFISRGQGVFESAQTSPAVIKEGTCFFLFPGIWHRYKPDAVSGWEEYWVGFGGYYPETLMKKGIFNSQTPFVKTGLNESLLVLFHQLIEAIQKGNPGYHQVISGIALQILGHMYTVAVHHEQYHDTEYPMIAKAKFLLQESLESPLNLPALARTLAVGYSKFRKDFKKATGLSPHQYHLNLRLNKARELLLSTHLSIYEIAYNTGFDSPFYFSKIFKKKNGLSPQTYREAHKT